MKARELRRKVVIQARMRVGATWSDACILNLSSRGMMVGAPSAPSRGSYLEIRRGCHVIVARVVWSNNDRFGVQTQDVIPTEELINHPDRAAAERHENGPFAERRVAPRVSSQRHEASRWRGRAMEFGAVAFLGAAGAMLVLGTLGELLAKPLAVVGIALGRP